MEDTMTMTEVAKAIGEHFGGMGWVTNQAIMAFLSEQDDEEGGTYSRESVEEFLAR